MANCRYCGQPAGFFKSRHAECETKHRENQKQIQIGVSKLSTVLLDGIKSGEDLNQLVEKVSEVENSYSIPEQEKKGALVKSWEAAVEHFLDDGILDETEETRLIEFKEHFSLSQRELDKKDSFTKIVKAAVIRDVLNGVVPQRMNLDSSDLSINFQKNEQIVWAFSDCNYYEDKIRRHYEGRSHGVSIRVAKGLYYRTGTFKGRPVESTVRVHVDTGYVVLTTKNIYFAGPSKSLRVPYNKIVSFEPFNNGIGIIRDTSTAKPQAFETGDGWFTYNLVINLSQM